MTKCIWLYIKQFCARINTDYDTVNCRYSFFYRLSYIVKHWKYDNDTWNKKKYVNSAVKNPADSFLKSGTSTTNDKQNHVHVYTNTNWKNIYDIESHLVLILAPMPNLLRFQLILWF